MPSSIHTFISAIADQEAGLAGLTHIETSKQTQLLHLAGDYREMGHLNDQLSEFLKLLIRKELILVLLLDEVLDLQHNDRIEET